MLSCLSPSFYSYTGTKLGAHRLMTKFNCTRCTLKPKFNSTRCILKPAPLPPSIVFPTLSPWLILPPVFKEGDINYMLYDFEQDKVENHKKVRRDGVDSDQVCRAMTSFGPGGRLAFCVPGVSTEWTPLGFEQFRDGASFHEMRPHVDFVYCSRRKVFTSITPCKFELMLHWNILDPDFKFPNQDDERKMDQVMNEVSEVWEEGQYLEMLRKECIQMPHLVCADQLSNDPLIVVRFVNRERGYTTVCFVVFKFNEEDGFSCSVVEDSNGLAISLLCNSSYSYRSFEAQLHLLYGFG